MSQPNTRRSAWSAVSRKVSSTARRRILLRPRIQTSGLYPVCDIAPAYYQKPFQAFFKRVLDIALSAMSLIVVLPLVAICAVWVKLDSAGPAFYVQQRVGHNGRVFPMFKLRTMVVNAHQQRDLLQHHNEANGAIFKMKADPRVTRVGRFLRKYSLDELPQIANVLCGHMSLVGPRPLPIEDVRKFEPRQLNWFRVPPGLTGCWQTQGRSDVQDFERIYQMECAYMQQWSLWLDLQLIWKTVGVVLNGKGAY